MGKQAKEIDMEAVLVEVGQFGKYQIINYCLILMPILFSAVYLSQYIFAAGAINYRCRVPQCESNPPTFGTDGWGSWALPSDGRCQRLQPIGTTCAPSSFHANNTLTCDSWIYDSYHTIVAEFDLACEEWKRTMVGTVHNGGVFAALAITALVSDNYGRRTAFLLTAVSAGVVGVARSYSTGYIMYLTLEFGESMVGAGVYSTGFILALEMVGLDRRVIGGNLISVTFALGQVVAALVAWAVPYWRTYTRVIYIPSLFFVFYYFYIEESVRWLLSKGRIKEAATIIYKAAEVNKRKLSPEIVKALSQEPDDTKSEASGPSSNEPSLFMQVMRSKKLVSRLVICSFWWITLTFVYYGLSINSVSLAGNMYVNFILTSLVEIPGYFMSALTLDRFGRKSSIITAFFICGASLLTLPFVSNTLGWLQVTLNMIGKLAISMAFSSVYIYTSELMPTAVRHSLLGLCSMIGRIGSLLAPQTPLLMVYWESLPYLLFGIMAMCSGLLMLLTPETLKMRLPDTILQAENINVATRTRKHPDILVS